jgi:hypothetical protein
MIKLKKFVILEHDFLKRICPDDKSHITQSLSRPPEYKICSSALNRSDITEPLKIPRK